MGKKGAGHDPTLAFQLLTSLSITMINMQAKPYGDSVIAGMGAVTRMISLGSLMVFGFIKGFQPIAGYNYGAGNYERLHEAIRISVVWSTLFCAVFGLTMAVFSGPVISRFTKNDMEMIRIGQKALKANGLSFLLFGFYTVYSSLFLAIGKAGDALSFINYSSSQESLLTFGVCIRALSGLYQYSSH